MTRASFSPRGQAPGDAERTLRFVRHEARRQARGLGRAMRRQGLVQWLATSWGAKPTVCMNCGKLGSHFVPPSLGEDGFFICEAVGLVGNKLTLAIVDAMNDMPEEAGECHFYVEPAVWDAIEARGEKWPPNSSKQLSIPTGGYDGSK